MNPQYNESATWYDSLSSHSEPLETYSVLLTHCVHFSHTDNDNNILNFYSWMVALSFNEGGDFTSLLGTRHMEMPTCLLSTPFQ